MKRNLLIFLILTGATSYAMADQSISIKILDYGIAGASDTSREDNKDVISGYITSGKNITIKETTERIPATMGINFGFHYLVMSAEDKNIVLDVKVLHPPLTNPNTQETKVSDEWQERAHCLMFKGFEGWTFDNDWELVPGEWIVQIYYKGEKLVEKSFVIYKPQI